MSKVILVVEDDAALQHVMVRNLAIRGFSVVGTETVAQALLAVEAGQPDLAILDIELPDGAGWEVLRVLRTNGGGHVPAIVMSAMRPNPRLVAELGCFAVIEKPFPMDSLIRLVAECLDGKAESTSHGATT